MKETFDNSAFIGIAFSNDVIYNYIESEGQFEFTGLSLVKQLQNNRNRLIAKIVESQSYECIRYLMDDEIVFGNRISTNNTNMSPYNEIYRLMEDEEMGVFDYYYIYDVVNDLLIVKTPDINKPMALDYKNRDDVDYFLEYK